MRSDGERVGGGEKSPKASGIVMVNGVLYLWVRNVGNSQLLWSRDHGKTWEWGFKMETSFGSPAFLNFGRNYRGRARRLRLHLFAGRPERVRERQSARAGAGSARAHSGPSAWEFFERSDARGQPGVDRDINRRGAVFKKPSGCQRVDVVYNPGIRRYLMALGYNHEGAWGLFDAPEPWGPWTTVFHTDGDAKTGTSPALTGIACPRNGFGGRPENDPGLFRPDAERRFLHTRDAARAGAVVARGRAV